LPWKRVNGSRIERRGPGIRGSLDCHADHLAGTSLGKPFCNRSQTGVWITAPLPRASRSRRALGHSTR
jgi:hypothetical protein